MKRILLITASIIPLLIVIPVIVFFYPRFFPQEISVKIGYMDPLSGEWGGIGISSEQAILLAKRHLGLTKVEVISKDTQCDPDMTAKATKELIEKDHVVAIIGESCSGATLVAAPIAQAHKVVLISPASTSPDLSRSGNFFFRTVPSDTNQGAYGAKLMYTDGKRKLALIHSDEAYGNSLAAVVSDEFKKRGGTVVADEKFTLYGVELLSQVKKIQAAHPDAIYVISDSLVSASAVLNAIHSYAIPASLYGSEAIKDDSLITNSPLGSDGLTVTSLPMGTPDYVNKYSAVYGAPLEYSAQAYDAMTAIGHALINGATNGDDIQRQLRTISFDGASGHIQFDHNGDLVGGTYDLYIVKNGKFVLK